MELHQNALLQKRSFFLLSNELKLYLKDMDGEYENYISYEKLTSKAKVCCRKDSKLFFITMAAIGFSICILLQSLILNMGFSRVIFPSLIALVFGILYQVKKESYVIVETVDSRKIIFLRNKPNRRSLEKFLNQLWVKRKQYLREKYFYIDRNRDMQQQMERLRWLFEQKAISQKEYKLAKEDWIIDRSYQPNQF